VKENAAEEATTLKEQSGKDMFIFGSADLSARLMRHRLIDEYRLGVVPVVLGSGNPLFKAGSVRTKLKLMDARPLKSGCVILRYQQERE
jgi:dihydrofolate reductase